VKEAGDFTGEKNEEEEGGDFMSGKPEGVSI
jgi:hypothetical protein